MNQLVIHLVTSATLALSITSIDLTFMLLIAATVAIGLLAGASLD
jgi:hypothetical protein